MTIAKILAPVTGSNRDSVILDTAIAAARPFNAHIVALFVHPDPREGVPYADFGMALSPNVIQELVDDAEVMAEKASSAAQAALSASASKAGCQIVGKPVCAGGVTLSFQESPGHFRDRVPEAARLSDLVVFAPILDTDNPEIGETLISTITRSGKPVLLSPVSPPKTIGRNVAVGWDGGQAAAHALTAAMPFLENASTIELLSVQRAPLKGSKCLEAAEYLRLHGLACAERDVELGSSDIGRKLLDSAVSSGADLLVIGGYGHSRLSETVFGGATVHILSNASLPVLLVH